MPTLNERNVRHLLRRTEFVDRDDRVEELLQLGSMSAVVDDILDTPVAPLSARLTMPEPWQQGQELSHFWIDQMAHDSARPMQEMMALFWHGHFCSSMEKVNAGPLMRDQIDLWRIHGLGDVRYLAVTMSTQVAMLRYLDNNANFASSPNQNFARELMELFLLGVGNYTEADVEAAAAAWTGHSDNWEIEDSSAYRWLPDEHDGRPKQFLGRTINSGGDARLHGNETIDVILGNGTIPAEADVVANRGRPSRQVAAEFLSRKLWIDFANDAPPPAVISAMAGELVGSNFSIRPWVKSMLLRDEFYADDVRDGLVRSPIQWMAAMLYYTGRRSTDTTPLWLMDAMGQAPLYPPNVSGWGTNGYYVNTSAIGSRAITCQYLWWNTGSTYWREDGTGYYQFRNGRLTNSEVVARTPWPEEAPVLSAPDLVDKIARLTDITLTPHTRQTIIDHAASLPVWDRNHAVLLVLLAPELQTA